VKHYWSLPFWHGTVQRIQDILCASTSLHSENEQQVSPVHWNSWESLQRVSVCDFSAEINLSGASLWTKSMISVLKQNLRLWILFVIYFCVYVCIYLYSFCDIIIILLTVLHWHCWRDSWWHCCSSGGLWRIFNSAGTVNCRQSSTDTCTEGMHYCRHSTPLYMNPFRMWIVGRGSWVCLLIGHAGPLLEGLVLGPCSLVESWVEKFRVVG